MGEIGGSDIVVIEDKGNYNNVMITSGKLDCINALSLHRLVVPH